MNATDLRGTNGLKAATDLVRLWDQMSFDPDYPTKPLSHFEPMLREVFSRQPFDPAVIGEREQAFDG